MRKNPFQPVGYIWLERPVSNPGLLQVGWRRSGLGIWSPAGCRLVCTLRQTGSQQNGSHTASRGMTHGLEGGISMVAWGVRGYSLLVAESGSAAQASLVTPAPLCQTLDVTFRVVSTSC